MSLKGLFYEETDEKRTRAVREHLPVYPRVGDRSAAASLYCGQRRYGDGLLEDR